MLNPQIIGEQTYTVLEFQFMNTMQLNSFGAR